MSFIFLEKVIRTTKANMYMKFRLTLLQMTGNIKVKIKTCHGYDNPINHKDIVLFPIWQ